MKLSMDDVRAYMRELLVAVKSVHEKNIIHRLLTDCIVGVKTNPTFLCPKRDIKPSNFLYNFRMRKGMLTDFGLAQASSSHFRGCF